MSEAPQPKPRRSHFSGVAQIVRYNWPFYLGGSIALAVAGIWLTGGSGAPWLRQIAGLAAAIGAFWMMASLVASHWIYDRSALYRWTWVPGALAALPRRWLNLHAGLDESSQQLRELLPDSEGVVADFFDATEMTEPSILRARSLQVKVPATIQISHRQLPFPDGSFDAVFLFFAAHELRQAGAREALFKELHRVLRSNGTLLLVEHVRDLANFAAFGPGCWHFLPLAEWHRLGASAGFALRADRRMTPFVHFLHWQKSA